MKNKSYKQELIIKTLSNNDKFSLKLNNGMMIIKMSVIHNDLLLISTKSNLDYLEHLTAKSTYGWTLKEEEPDIYYKYKGYYKYGWAIFTFDDFHPYIENIIFKSIIDNKKFINNFK